MNYQVTNGDQSCCNKTTGLKVNSTTAPATMASAQQSHSSYEMSHKT